MIVRKISLIILIISVGSLSRISAQSITVTSPNGGENWTANSTQFIKWESKNIDRVKINYSLDNGLSWGTIAQSVDASSGEYIWVTPNVKTPYVLIRISDAYNTNVYDVSDQSFSINILKKNNQLYKTLQTSSSADTFKLMPLGDSITWGTNPDDSTSPGYRRRLDSLLTAAGYQVNFIGSLSGGEPQDFDRDNEGHPGWFAGSPSYPDNMSQDMGYNLTSFLNANPPNVILLHMGTNDIGEDGATWEKTATQAAQRVGNLLDTIYNFNSDPSHNIVIFLAQIIDDADKRNNTDSAYWSSTIHQKCLDFNSYLASTIVPGRPSNQKIVLVNMYNALGRNYHTPSNPYFDTQYDVHPNTLGYNKMADTWFAALQNYYQPVLASPGNGVTGQPTNLVLSWSAPQAASDMLSHSESFNYELQVATNPDFSLAHIAYSSASISSGSTSTSPSGLQYGTQYFWRVRVYKYGWSAVRNFTTEPEIDSIYVTSISADSATLNSEINTGSQSTIIRFQWDTNNDAVWPNDQAASNSPLSSDGTGTLNITGLSPNTTYYFRSYVSNAIASDTSSVKSFTTSQYAAVKATIFLQGPYAGGDTMYTTLWQDNLIPASQPYGDTPWSYSGNENVSSLPSNIVDWILVQLRSDTSTVVATRAALLKSDGSIVDTNGTSPVKFNGVEEGAYYIVIEHRNHLSVMSKNKVNLPNSVTYNFSTAQTQAYGSNPMSDLGGGTFGMISGDANGNGQVQNNDSESIWKPDNGTSGYKSSDFNLNGEIQNNDNENYWKPNNGKGTQVPLPI